MLLSRDLGDLGPLSVPCSLHSPWHTGGGEASGVSPGRGRRVQPGPPIPREAVSLEPPTLLSVSPYHSMKIATLGVRYHAVCVGPLILKTMTLGSLGDRASELIDDLVPKRVKLGLNPGCILKFLACSIRGQDRLSFLGPEGQTLPPFLTLPLRS